MSVSAATQLNIQKTAIPLKDRHLEALWDSLSTARFEVKQGATRRYSGEYQVSWNRDLRLPQTPDGIYEFLRGTAYEIGWGGKSTILPQDHPLLERSPELLYTLYNFGMEWVGGYSPDIPNQVYFPNRYGYFRDGDLYCMGSKVFSADDPLLQTFLSQEQAKADLGFVDHGAPLLADGRLDTERLQRYGLKVPEGHYLALGDNHAMSQDSRYFGFVPQGNIRGAPSFLFWPWDNRDRELATLDRPWFTLPNVVVWGFLAVVIGAIYAYFRKQRQKPVFKKLSA